VGKHYRLEDLDARPRPVQEPHPPLIMGGNAGPRSAALAARFADEYNTPFPTLDDVHARRRRIVEACDKAGRGPIPFSVMAGYLVGRDHEELEDRARRLGKKLGVDPQALLKDPPSGWIVGDPEEALEYLAKLKQAGVSRVMCQHLLHDDLDAVALLGRELAPLLA
jgi:alkanesulfonate monooxygenase SsuD/methylene tetrahydromethanopterin reductase-like flavin-dependent oxidoreductase (luciferase family)